MKKFFKNLLAISGILLALYLLVQGSLRIFDLQLRAWINVWWLGITALVFILGILQQIFKVKNIKLKIGSIVAIIAAIVLLLKTRLGLLLLMTAWVIPHEEQVAIIDGYKFIGYVDDSWDTFIDFYDYKNAFVSGATLRFTALGYYTDEESGKKRYYDELRYIDHLEDIYEYKQGYFTEKDLTKESK